MTWDHKSLILRAENERTFSHLFKGTGPQKGKECLPQPSFFRGYVSFRPIPSQTAPSSRAQGTFLHLALRHHPSAGCPACRFDPPTMFDPRKWKLKKITLQMNRFLHIHYTYIYIYIINKYNIYIYIHIHKQIEKHITYSIFIHLPKPLIDFMSAMSCFWGLILGEVPAAKSWSFRLPCHVYQKVHKFERQSRDTLGLPPTQDASGKWRFTGIPGFPIKNVIFLVVTVTGRGVDPRDTHKMMLWMR